jgi:hypothetical protein
MFADFNRVFIHLFPLEVQLTRTMCVCRGGVGGGGGSINQSNPATFVVPVQTNDLDFQHHMW